MFKTASPGPLERWHEPPHRATACPGVPHPCAQDRHDAAWQGSLTLKNPIRNDYGPSHCLETEDLDQVTTQLRERGIEFTERKLGCDDTWQIWLKDPDGNRFEVHQYTPESMQFPGGTVEADWSRQARVANRSE